MKLTVVILHLLLCLTYPSQAQYSVDHADSSYIEEQLTEADMQLRELKANAIAKGLSAVFMHSLSLLFLSEKPLYSSQFSIMTLNGICLASLAIDDLIKIRKIKKQQHESNP